MRLAWTPEALDDLAEIRAYVAESDPGAAKSVLERSLTVVEHLSAAPNIGRPGRVDGTRELVVTGTPFIVPYRIAAGRIEILRVYHGARVWPDSL